MSKNLNRFERGARLFAGVILLFLSFAAFSHPVARLLVLLAGAWVALEGIFGGCPLYYDLGLKKPGPMKAETVLWLMVAGVQGTIGYVWWHAGWIKIWSGDFISNLPTTLAYYAANNPYPFMKNVLMNQPLRYYGLYGGLIELSQYLIGIGLVALAYVLLAYRHDIARRATLYLSVVGLVIGALMSGLLYFAVGHIDPWVAAGSVAMFWAQLVLAYGYISLLISDEGKK